MLLLAAVYVTSLLIGLAMVKLDYTYRLGILYIQGGDIIHIHRVSMRRSASELATHADFEVKLGVVSIRFAGISAKFF